MHLPYCSITSTHCYLNFNDLHRKSHFSGPYAPSPQLLVSGRRPDPHVSLAVGQDRTIDIFMADEHDRIEILRFWLEKVCGERSEIRQDRRIHKSQSGNQNISVFVVILVARTAENGRP